MEQNLDGLGVGREDDQVGDASVQCFSGLRREEKVRNGVQKGKIKGGGQERKATYLRWLPF